LVSLIGGYESILCADRSSVQSGKRGDVKMAAKKKAAKGKKAAVKAKKKK
jgi:hypothetical protein